MTFNWQQKGWPKATVNTAALRDELDAFKVILRMFEDGMDGINAGLSAAKWVRMTKVAKRTAERDLADLAAVGAVVAINGGPQTRYQLNIALADGAIEPLNEPLNAKLLRVVGTHPGTNLQYLTSAVTVSRATVKRAVAALVAAGKIEHRGSKKTGGYYAKDAEIIPGLLASIRKATSECREYGKSPKTRG